MYTYPYYKKIHSLKKIKKTFKDLQNYKVKLINKNEVNQFMKKKYKFDRLEGKHVIFINYHTYPNFLNEITNYFSEECRVRCKKYMKDMSAYDKFLEFKKEKYDKDINQYRYNVTLYLWKNSYLCELYKVTSCLNIYKYFNPKNILDFSSGWGDRLIAACAAGIKYTGVDPSDCMAPIYKKIIKTLVPKNKQKNYKVIRNGFENTNFKEKFDFIFSSPPFFKQETYEKNNTKQSISKFKTNKEWKEKFLYVIIKKCYKYLEKDGYFCIHIFDDIHFRFINDMMNFIRTKTKFKYVGKIYQITSYKDKNLLTKNVYLTRKPIFIRVFRK